MRANYQNFKSTKPGREFSKIIFSIKFGNKYYKVSEHQINYVYYKEGVTFLVNEANIKLPISNYDLNRFFAELNPQQFFNVTDIAIINRAYVLNFEEYENHSVVELHNYSNRSLKIPKNLTRKFKAWLTN